jgi:hypothetical protein
MRERGGKTPRSDPPKSKAKSKGSRKSTAKKPQQEPPPQKKHGKKYTTSLGMATALTSAWRKWSYAERRMSYLKALDMNAEAAGDRAALQEEFDLLPAYIDKPRLAFRSIEKEMKEGAYASVDLKTQLEIQPNHPGRRTLKSLMAELKPKKRKRSAVGGATSPEP